jgi:hypothetical protein
MTIGVSKPLSLEAVGLLLYEVVFLRKETKMKSAPPGYDWADHSRTLVKGETYSVVKSSLVKN